MHALTVISSNQKQSLNRMNKCEDGLFFKLHDKYYSEKLFDKHAYTLLNIY